MASSSLGAVRPKALCHHTGVPGFSECRQSPFGGESCFLSGGLKHRLCQDPDTQNEAVHLMIVQRAK